MVKVTFDLSTPILSSSLLIVSSIAHRSKVMYRSNNAAIRVF